MASQAVKPPLPMPRPGRCPPSPGINKLREFRREIVAFGRATPALFLRSKVILPLARAAFQRAGGSEEGHFDDPQFQKLFYGQCLRLMVAGEFTEGLEYAEA
jgi:hypothetical protein